MVKLVYDLAVEERILNRKEDNRGMKGLCLAEQRTPWILNLACNSPEHSLLSNVLFVFIIHT